MKRFCKVLLTLNKYKGAFCNSIQDAEYTFEVEWFPELTTEFNDGFYTLTAYHNGMHSDLKYNGWTFAGVNKGGYHFRGKYDSVDINIECRDPDGAILKITNSTRETSAFYTEGAALYMNLIMLVCLFKDKQEYESISNIFQNDRQYTLDKEQLKVILTKLQKLNEVIKRNEESKNVPPHFVANAREEYRRIVNYIKEKVKMETIFEALFD